MGTIPCVLGVFANLQTVLTQSKHNIIHCLEGLLPLIVCLVYTLSCLRFTVVAWTKPIYFFGAMSFFYSLNCSRVIIATVTKQKYSILRDFHLTVPILAGIVVLPVNALSLGIKEEHLYMAITASSIGMYFWYICNVINQITSYLGIYCLTIKKKVE